MTKLSTGFCVRCKRKTGNVSPHMSTTKNGRKMLRSNCSVCKGKKCQFTK